MRMPPKKKLLLLFTKKNLKKLKKEADAACVALLALPTSQKLQTALQNAVEKIKQLQSEIEELKITLANLPTAATIYQWLEKLKDKNNFALYREFIKISVNSVFSFANGQYVVIWSQKQNAESPKLAEIKEALAQMTNTCENALLSQKTKKDSITSNCCDTVPAGSPPNIPKERLFVMGERLCILILKK